MQLFKFTIAVLFVLASAMTVCVHAQTNGTADFSRITQQELEMLLADVAEANPMVFKRFEEDPEMKRAQLDSLRELLAFASEAQRSGLAARKELRTELGTIRDEVTAVVYDRHINKAKALKGPFVSISDSAVAAYWGENGGTTLSAALKAQRNAKFEDFLGAKTFLLRSTSPEMKDRTVTDEERAQARDMFAKIQIYAGEYARRASLMPPSLRQKIALQIKLQQAQFLARLYSEKLAREVTVSDEEIAVYLKAHPDLDTSVKRAKAEGILARAKAGENFAKLANEFSEDPGNKPQPDQLQGGLYKDVNVGMMVAPFERAALALEAGQISPQLVETPFGFHIIKLERKSSVEPKTYDVRHILIATTIADPTDPNARPVPVHEFVKKEIESIKERQIIDRVVAANNISVPDDFVVPAIKLKPPVKKAGAKPKSRPKRKRT
jgi:hypothetical protein